MHNLPNSRNYILVKSKKELELAKQNLLCCFIIWEDGNIIKIWKRENIKWAFTRYVMFGEDVQKDYSTTGRWAYQSLYDYCGIDNINYYKQYYRQIDDWECVEQMHYANFDYSDTKIMEPIYEFDVNASFSKGILDLPSKFNKLKDYAVLLYNKRMETEHKQTREKYKNLINYAIGYFARIKELKAVRSNIINNSNINVKRNMVDIIKSGGTCFLSNTDSIITDQKGYELMIKRQGNNIGDFKLSKQVDRLYYLSSNIYQLGNKVVYSGVKYFARKHFDFFNERCANQSGSLIESFDFIINFEGDNLKVCRIRFGQIEVQIFNKIGELLDTIIYKADIV